MRNNLESAREFLEDKNIYVSPRDGVSICYLEMPDLEKLFVAYAQLVSDQPKWISDEEINTKNDEYSFRVPYDGSNKFYDDAALKHFDAGAKWMRSQIFPTPPQSEEG